MKPIIFNSEMVRAILEGRKTQTRRVLNEKHLDKWFNYQDWASSVGRVDGIANVIPSMEVYLMQYAPYSVGDTLYVREKCIISPKYFDGVRSNSYNVTDPDGDGRICQYLATTPDTEAARDYKLKTTPSIHMPRWAARIFLKVTSVRIERLNEISEEDAIAEGIHHKSMNNPCVEFQWLWQSIYGNWNDNPWVWVIEFERIEKPEAKP